MIRTVLFDLDGTLTDSREGIVNSVKYAIEKLGGTMPDQQTLLKFICPPLQESFMAYRRPGRGGFPGAVRAGGPV